MYLKKKLFYCTSAQVLPKLLLPVMRMKETNNLTHELKIVVTEFLTPILKVWTTITR